MHIEAYRGSESESSAESGSFNIVVNVFVGDGVLDDLPGAEGDVSGGVEIGGSLVKGALSGSPLLNLGNLNHSILLILCLSCHAQRR